MIETIRNWISTATSELTIPNLVKGLVVAFLATIFFSPFSDRLKSWVNRFYLRILYYLLKSISVVAYHFWYRTVRRSIQDGSQYHTSQLIHVAFLSFFGLVSWTFVSMESYEARLRTKAVETSTSERPEGTHESSKLFWPGVVGIGFTAMLFFNGVIITQGGRQLENLKSQLAAILPRDEFARLLLFEAQMKTIEDLRVYLLLLSRAADAISAADVTIAIIIERGMTNQATLREPIAAKPFHTQLPAATNETA